jgi:NAD(P)-dependent dehydrogenase (short-subunit alcohol dehydrogenase family)
MKIIVVGATGTIGKEVVKVLENDHEIVKVAHRGGDFKVDIASTESIEKLFNNIGPFDAVISTAGLAKFGGLDELTKDDYLLGLTNKLMGQVNLFLIGRRYINKNGSFTLTSGVLSQEPMKGSASISMVNAGLEGFVRAAVLEIGDGIRLNVVSPVFVKETMEAMGMDSTHGMPAAKVALAYKESVESLRNGEILDVRKIA